MQRVIPTEEYHTHGGVVALRLRDGAQAWRRMGIGPSSLWRRATGTMDAVEALDARDGSRRLPSAW
jgi:hypothetical protein